LPADVVGVPMTVDLIPTLELALRLHPGTRRVFVIAGRSKTDSYWVEEARRAFRGREGAVGIRLPDGFALNDPLAESRGISGPERRLLSPRL